MNRKQRRTAQAQSHQKPASQPQHKAFTVEEASMLAMQQYNLKNYEVAAGLYNIVLAKNPSAENYNNLGVTLHEMGRNEEAVATFDKALALKPDLAVGYNNRGNALLKLERYDEALAGYDKAVALKPDYVDAHKNRGVILQTMERFAEALVSYDKAIALKSDLMDVHNYRGNVLYRLKRYEEALASYDKTIALKPDYADAYTYNNRGISLQELKRYDEALVSLAKAIALKPDMAEAYNNWGGILFEMKRYDEALPYYEKAVAFQADYTVAYQNRGNALLMLKRFDEALPSFEKALALEPDTSSVLGELLHTKMYLCDWRGTDALFEQLMRRVDAGEYASNPFLLLPTAASALQQKKCAEICLKNKYMPDSIISWSGKKYTHDKIRIGYFSADFYNHATACLMAKLFEIHDRSRFEITAFSFGLPKSDSMVTRLQKAFDHFIDISAKSDVEIAQLAREMEIDIAVDLKGFTKDSRPGIFTQRPAPVQVNYLGFPGTMGANYIDYIIADATVIPEEHKPYYSEKIVYLPGSYQVNDSSRRISDKALTRRKFGLPEEGFVFCSFNNNYKITPVLFDIWMRLLHKVPGSVLWLFAGNKTAEKNLYAEAASRGIPANRLVIARYLEVSEHLARHRLADLFLDTFPCNAHTTASDALWAGLPMITYLGETFAGRVAASLLNAVGLPELITHSHAEYEAVALDLATHPEKLSAIKTKLAQNRETASLFNTELFAKNIEAAYIKMWEKTQRGEEPDHIYVDTAL